MSSDHEKYFEILRKYDTPTVCNVIEQFDARGRHRGWMNSSIRAVSPKMPPIVGYATTATFRSAEQAKEGDVYTTFTRHIASFVDKVPAPRVVVIQDLDEPFHGATFGEVMCSTYKSFGCAGLITSGGARDIDQVEAIDFPTWSSGISPSHSYCRMLDVDVPVEVGGIEVKPGDVIHADCNGVTTIPNDLVAEIALGCQKLVDAEEEVIGYVRSTSNPTVQELEAAQARSQERMKEIVEQVRAELG